MVDLFYTALFLIFGIPLIIVELIGVFRPERGDTISENVWWLQKRFWPFRVIMAGFTGWLFVHFLFDGAIV